jgi:SAM-dependent methyltransferase
MSVEHLPPVVAEAGEAPEDIGTGHAMREVTERVAADPAAWNAELAALVGSFFDERAPDWAATRSGRSEVLADALDRGAPAGTLPAAGTMLAAGSLLAAGTMLEGPAVELGAGTGAGTRVLAERFDHVIAGDLAGEMLARLPEGLASRVRLDASRLPFPDRSVGVVVCVNMLLFAGEVDRVLADRGALVWVSSIGERTPIYLSAEAVADSLGDGYDVVASRCGWGTWAVARRR